MKRAHPHTETHASLPHDTPLRETHVFGRYFSKLPTGKPDSAWKPEAKNLRTIPNVISGAAHRHCGKLYIAERRNARQGEKLFVQERRNVLEHRKTGARLVFWQRKRWNVGRDIPILEEMEKFRQQQGEPGRKSPHWRMGHFAIRRTGEGHTDKTIVWIKETFVNKNLLKEVPHGYHGKEAAED